MLKTGGQLYSSLLLVVLLCLPGCAQEAPLGDGSGLRHEVVLHHPGNLSKAPKTYTLHQIRNQKGFPTGYKMVVESVVCMEKNCEVISVTMFWDALGGYQRYELEKGKVLEKGVLAGKDKTKPVSYKGVPFTDADYKKLDRILKDGSSILSTRKLSDMSVARDKNDIDAVSSATPIAMKNAVVQGASLTCFQLWHWANGEIVEVAKELTHLSCSEDMLHNFLLSDKPHFVLFALEHLKRHKLFSPSIVKEVGKVVRSGDREMVDPGLVYLKEAMPKAQYYDNLATIFNESHSKRRIHLLKLLSLKKELPGTLFDKMSSTLASMKTYYELHLFLRLVEKYEYVSQPILTQSSQLLESTNFFIARRAFWYLEKQTLDSQVKTRVQAFREKSRKEDRLLH
jgi:hypothetical protein